MQKELLFSMYDKAHESILEGDRKRDQIIAFYTVITGAIVSIMTGENDIFSNLKNSDLWITLIAGIMGINYITAKIIANYRIFHMKYHISAQVLQRFIFDFSNKEVQENTFNIQDRLNRYYMDIYCDVFCKEKSIFWEYIKFPFKSTENLVYLFYVNISFINVFMMIPGKYIKMNLLLPLYILYYISLVYLVLLKSIRREWRRIHNYKNKNLSGIHYKYLDGSESLFYAIDIRGLKDGK